jgi:FlaA1/EpsC-like NDP-sugar epimerase
VQFDLSFEKVIGRKVNLQISEILKSIDLEGERVLITGAGGSIGSKISLELSRMANCILLLTDRDENRLHTLSLDLIGTALFNTSQFKVLDVRDLQGIELCVNAFQPTTIIHAAALKHLSILENQPREAYLTNVVGTMNMLETATKFGSVKFLNISTDKAANPSSILGKSKWLGELFTSFYRREQYRQYTSVRFGNVFNSRGSVIETFANQLAKNQPITLTDINVKRYFMKIEEASSLSIASVFLNLDEIHLLRMGEPIRLLDVINKLRDLIKSDSPLEIVGLRTGEKIDEDLIAPYELARSTSIKEILALNSNVKFQDLPRLTKEVLTDYDAVRQIDRLIQDTCSD